MAKKGTDHQSQITRLKRVEGQVRGVQKMVEEQRYCTDILTQIKAIKAALISIEASIVEEHFNHCVHDAFSSNNKKKTQDMVEEVKKLLKTAIR